MTYYIAKGKFYWSDMRIVIKIGTSTLTHASGHLNLRLFEELCRVISDIKGDGNEVIVVSSGAIAMGVGKLALKEKPADIPTKQAAAAVGQCELMYNYDKFFGEYNHTVAQILITLDDIENEKRRRHFTDTMERLLEMGVLPIVNENDTVATSEMTVGDNDTLSAVVAVSAKADLLILLSDIDGLYSGDPKKSDKVRLIPVVEEIDDGLLKIAGGAGSALGTGGMHTKVCAARSCMKNGVDMIIANGSDPRVLYDIMDGKSVGTLFKGVKK